jgi:dienelactone hydrolase
MMGFSRGGQATLYASLRRFQRMHGRATASFAAYIPFYPDCMTTFVGDEDLVDKPVRIFHGTADNWDPVASCRAYVERLRRAGKDVQLTEYAGAAHTFDARANATPRQLPNAQTVRNCKLREDSEGSITNVVTQQHFTYADPCVERGVTIAYDARAQGAAQKAVGDFLASLLSQK